MNFAQLHSEYTGLLARCDVRGDWSARINRAARYIIAHRDRYERVSTHTGVPWAFIGVLHWRESSGDFNTHLHNGDPLTARTRHVPEGRPLLGTPPFDWEESATDALRMKGLFGSNIDWTMERVCYEAERFNGWGYRSRRTEVNSPYLWSGTSLYTRGKFYADHKFSLSVIDKQVGVIPVYMRIQTLLGEKSVRRDSRKLRLLDQIVLAIKTFLSTVTGLFTMDTWGVLQSWFGITGMPWNVLLAIAVCGIAVWVLAHWLTKMALEDHAAGRWVASGEAERTPAVHEDPYV